NGVILRALPYPDPGRLTAVTEVVKASRYELTFSYPDFLDCARENPAFQSLAAYRNSGANLTAPGNPEYISLRQVSTAFFPILGVKPLLGRTFSAEEDRPGAAPAAMIGYSLWRQRFGGRADAIGSRLVLNGKSYTVLGVLPQSFQFLEDRQIFTAIGADLGAIMSGGDLHPGIQAIGRLKPGVTFEQASSEMDLIGDRLAREYPKTDAGRTIAAKPLKQGIVGDVRPTLLLLAGAVGLVLLIACANVANLFLARSLSRTREFAIRTALGAGRRRLIRQLLTESILLSLAGGAAGFALAAAGTHWALALLPDWLPRADEISLDLRVLLFTLAASVFTGIVFGLAPTIRRRESERGLQVGARGTARGVLRLQSGFVIAEIALALVLLAGAGLMMRTILRLWSVNPGFDTHRLLVMTVGLSPKVAHDPQLIRTAWREILERVQRTPGVQAAAVDTLVPLRGESEIAYWTGPATEPPKNAPIAIPYTPTPDYLGTMKIPLLRGRFFTTQDRLGTDPVAVVDELFAKRVFPGQEAVGSKLSLQWLGPVRVVGVVGHIKNESIDEDPYAKGHESVYVPFSQIPDPFMPQTLSGMGLLVRTSVNPTAMMEAVKRSVLGPSRDQPVRDMETMEQMIGESLARRRAMLWMLAIFAGVALLLAAIGIYGVISYSMNRRVQEIGVRMALGAQPGQVLRLIVAQGMRMAIAGVVLGAVASAALMRLMTNLLYGISPADPLTFSAVVSTLLLVSLAAVYIPARRAARVDPMLALRHE
ncbi:MAG TPA: ABC transporter permease, partial [Bryobacteraceae bacterium]|nr:ABC transporter permease [Bryobacteraceae bacterium]